MSAQVETVPRPSLWLIFAITVTGITANALPTPSIPEILAGLHASEAAAGLFVAATTAPGILLAPLIGILADRYGRREVLIPCLIVFGIGGGLAAFAQSLWFMVAMRFLQGAGSAGLVNLAVVIIGDHWDGAERARIIGRNAAVLTMAIAVLPPLGGLLTDAAGWRAMFAVYPVAFVTAVVVARRLPRSARHETTLREQLAAAWPVLRSGPVVRLLVGGLVLFVLVFGLFLTVMPIYAQEAFGLDASERGLLLGLPALGATVAALLLGRLTARFGRGRLIVVAWALFALGLAVIAAAPTLALVAVGVVLYGLGEGTLIPGLQDVAVSVGTAATRGAVVAVWVGAARLGQTVGPLLAVVGMTAYGGAATFGIGAGIAAAALLLLVVAGRSAIAAPTLDRAARG